MSTHIQGQVQLISALSIQVWVTPRRIPSKKVMLLREAQALPPMSMMNPRQHHGYSLGDHYQNIWISYHHALLTHSFRHQVHISPDSNGPNSEEFRGTWKLAIPWRKGGDGVIDRGSAVIGGGEASVVIGGGEASRYYLVYSFYCFSLCLSTLFL